MAQRIFLHIGSHKTGTTAVQAWLQANEAILADAGLRIPTAGRNTNQANSRALAMALTMPRGKGHKSFGDIRKAFRAEVAANPDKDFIVSAEYFSLVLTRATMTLAARRLRRFGLDITTALVIRNPIDLINSDYAQRCKTLRYKENFDSYFKDFSALRRSDWPHRVRRLRKLDMDPRVGVYQPSKTQSPFQIMRLFGLEQRVDAALFQKTERKNHSIGELGVMCSYHFKRAMSRLEIRPNRAAKDWLSARLIETVRPEETRGFNGFSSGQIEAMENEYRPQLETLANEYLNGDGAALLASQTGSLAQSPLIINDIPSEMGGKVSDMRAKILIEARARPEFKTHFPIDPFQIFGP